MAPEVYARARAFLGMARGELLKLADDNLKQAEEKTRSPCPNQRFQSLTENVEDHAHAPYRAYLGVRFLIVGIALAFVFVYLVWGKAPAKYVSGSRAEAKRTSL